MKKSSALIIVASLMLTACGSLAQYASSDSGQQYRDGIYNNTPAFRTRGEKEASKSETQALVEQTKESPIYLFGDKKDTVMIPHDMSATIRYDQKLGGTVVTVGENPYDWRYDLENNYGYWYSPYSFGSPWYRSRFYSPWNTWSYRPWGSWYYDPWYWGGWYDPYYYGSWYYDSWFYAGGWYDPWYYDRYWHHHHHQGWYDPYWDHHHHQGGRPENYGNRYYGQRYETGSDRVFTSGTSLRGGIGRTSTVSRTERSETVASRAATRSDRATPSRSTAVRTTPSARKEALSSSRVTGSPVTSARPASNISSGTARRPVTAVSGSSAGRPAAGVSRPSTSVSRPVSSASRPASQSAYRRPSSSVSGAVRGTSSATRQSYDSGSSSRSSYSSGISSSSRSSYSGGSSSSSRSSYSGGGGGGSYSRSSSSSGRR